MPILANKLWHIGSILFTPLATANCFGEALTKRLEYPWITSRGDNIKDRTAQQNGGETGVYRSQGSEQDAEHRGAAIDRPGPGDQLRSGASHRRQTEGKELKLVGGLWLVTKQPKANNLNIAGLGYSPYPPYERPPSPKGGRGT